MTAADMAAYGAGDDPLVDRIAVTHEAVRAFADRGRGEVVRDAGEADAREGDDMSDDGHRDALPRLPSHDVRVLAADDGRLHGRVRDPAADAAAVGRAHDGRRRSRSRTSASSTSTRSATGAAARRPPRPQLARPSTPMSDVVVEPMSSTATVPPWESVAEAVTACRGGEALTVRPFAGGLPLVHTDADRAALRDLVLGVVRPGRPVIDAARAFCHDIYTSFEYDPAFTDVSTPLADGARRTAAACARTSPTSPSAGLRELGLAARYVSGYIETSPPPGAPRLVGADASHAWCSVWVPGTVGGMGRLRPDERPAPGAPPRHGRVGPRLRRRGARPRRRHRPERRPEAVRRGRCRARAEPSLL